MSHGSLGLAALGLALALACSPESGTPDDAPDAAAKPAAEAAVQAASGAEGAEVASGAEDGNTIYAIGYSMARNLTGFDLREDELAQLQAGLADAVLGRESKVPLAEYNPKIRALRQSRQQAVARAEEEQGSAWVEEFSAEEGVVVADSGLVMKTLEPGEGPSPAAKDRVRVHYHGTLRDGTVFDSSVDRGEPVEFPLNRVIPCWTEALQKMSAGGKAHFLCPAKIAYGERGSPPRIKPGATLAFEVELLEVKQPEAAPAPAAP